MATNITKEEDNFLRIVYLTYRVGTTALRRYFDGFHPNLQSDLSFPPNKAILLDLHKPPKHAKGQRKVLYQEQWNILYPSSGSPVVSSVDLDTTLMVCLLRHLPPNILPPAFGFDALPQSHELSDGAHIARIKYYKNFIVSHSKDGKLSDTDCNRIWIDLEMAIHSLGNQQDVTDAADAKSKSLDYNTLKKLVNFDDSIQRNVNRLNDHSNELAVQSSKITKLESTMQKGTEEHSGLKKKITKIEIEQEECIPKNIRDQIEIQLKDWGKKDEMCVTTRASDYVIECISDNSCLTLTGPSGVGKSFIARHTALVLQKEGYKVIPVLKPDDIRNYYQPGKQTVFIVDDICGNFTANQQQIQVWTQLLPLINTVIADKYCKIIVSCRLQVYKDDKFNILAPFKSCECNLMSDKLCLTSVEKNNLIKTYTRLSLSDVDRLSQNCEFFPLLCSLYHEEKHGDVKEFFKNPFSIYQNELDNLRSNGDEGNYKICSLCLLVLFDNKLNEKWFKGKVTNEQRYLLEDTCGACRLNRGTSKEELKEALNTLDGTFVHKQNGIYKTVHDKLFDFLAYYFGQKMIECLIDHGDSELVRTRFKWRISPDDKIKYNLDFIIEISDDCLEAYLQRSQQITLANTYDTNSPKEHYISDNTPLILACGYDYTDIAQWVLHDNVDVNQCRDDGVTGLNMASQEGHINIVKMLLERNPEIDSCGNNGCSPFYMASQNGHTEIVRLLLERNPNVNRCDNKGCSLLRQASQNGHTDIVKLLLERNPNINLCGNDGGCPLYMACQYGHIDIVKLLLEKNSNINLCDNNGASPLYMASQNRHTDIVKLLLERNPNIDLCINDGRSPLFIASQTGHIDIVKLLLGTNSHIDLCCKNGCSPLYIASQNGHIDIVELLLVKKPSVDLCNKIGFSPLSIASFRGHTKIVKVLLEKSPNIDLCDKDGCSPLYMASQKGYIEIVKLLLERNSNVDLCNHGGCSPLRQASQEGHTDIVKLLLNRNPQIDLCDNVYGCSPLNMASQKGYTVIVKLLLERNPNIDLCDKNGCSALYMASQEGYTDIVRLLLEQNPNVDLSDINGSSPLIIASQQGHTAIVKLLLQMNPNINLCNNDGFSPLYIASQEGHTDIVKLLLEKNYNIGLGDKDGWSSLRKASSNGHTKKGKLLLESISNVDLCDNNRCSPLFKASQNGHTEIVQVLLRKNPKIDLCDKNGCSPLLMASHNGHTDIVKILLDRNHDVDLCLNDGRSPLYMASKKGHTAIVKLLLEKNPNIDLCDNDGCSPLNIAIQQGHTDIVGIGLIFTAIHPIRSVSV
ncbi:Hypothetical predicted protein [Mytilus galloprovincialis]|uniref:DZIP3-like HEPN domain-containing protein n=1 Tax=Mytilus galloprovincialis TaxID=29158 RepID=A0A8B6D416_MYTGA|nr:Hypothetical predicted protein [Mytilus galloprovincialis]